MTSLWGVSVTEILAQAKSTSHFIFFSENPEILFVLMSDWIAIQQKTRWQQVCVVDCWIDLGDSVCTEVGFVWTLMSLLILTNKTGWTDTRGWCENSLPGRNENLGNKSFFLLFAVIFSVYACLMPTILEISKYFQIL